MACQRRMKNCVFVTEENVSGGDCVIVNVAVVVMSVIGVVVCVIVVVVVCVIV